MRRRLQGVRDAYEIHAVGRDRTARPAPDPSHSGERRTVAA